MNEMKKNIFFYDDDEIDNVLFFFLDGLFFIIKFYNLII